MLNSRNGFYDRIICDKKSFFEGPLGLDLDQSVQMFVFCFFRRFDFDGDIFTNDKVDLQKSAKNRDSM